MESRAKINSILYNPVDHIYNLSFDTRLSTAQIENLQNMKNSELDLTVKKHREKRSLNANAYMWVLLDKIADVLNTTKEELYLEALSQYGCFTHVVVRKEAVDRFAEEYRLIKNLGEITVGTQKGIQLQCYFGSSCYDTKEMSRLVDGVCYMAKEAGVETLPPEEIERLKKEWENG